MTGLDIDPSVVQPGWTPLIIILLLAAVMVLLFFSMRKQVRRIHIPPEGSEKSPTHDASTSPRSPA